MKLGAWVGAIIGLASGLIAGSAKADGTYTWPLFNGYQNPISPGSPTVVSNSDYFSPSYAASENRQHVGIDLDADDGQQIFAIDDGEIIQFSRDYVDGFNVRIMVRHYTAAGTPFIAIYGHCNLLESIYSASDRFDPPHAPIPVSKGDPLGTIISAGTGPHLHFGINVSSSPGDFMDAAHGFGRIPVGESEADAEALGWRVPLDQTQPPRSGFLRRYGAADSDVQWLASDGGNDHFYRIVVPQQPISWEEAKLAAETAGGYLATITSAAENEFVFGFASSSAPSDVDFAFLGGFQLPNSGRRAGWRWVTGEEFSYTRWASSEPNDAGGFNEDKLMIWINTAFPYGWNDTLSSTPFSGSYVIESELPIGASKFANVPGGEFTMGDVSGDAESGEAERTVFVSEFLIGKTEVTKSEWDSVRTWGSANGYDDLPQGGSKGTNHPVHDVNWFDVVKWCNARSEMEGYAPCYWVAGAVYRDGQASPDVRFSNGGYRLPTEAEWEKAARGGFNGLRFPWGDIISHANANYEGSASHAYDVSPSTGPHPDYNSGGHPYSSPVASFPANGYGLHDMTGNMWEWCGDWFGPYESAPQTNPRGATSGTKRVFRGGDWNAQAHQCRVAYRSDARPTYHSDGFGFRVARSLLATFSNEATFLAASGATLIESFENLPAISPDPVTIQTPAITISPITPNAELGIETTTPGWGGRPRDGSSFLHAASETSYSFEFDFGQPVTALGFWITDWGESPATMTLTTDTGEVFVFDSTQVGGGDNSELFLGISTSTPFSSVIVQNDHNLDTSVGIDSIYARYVTPTSFATSDGLLCHYPFDGYDIDLARPSAGSTVGSFSYIPGPVGSAAHLDGATNIEADLHMGSHFEPGDPIHISFWFRADPSAQHRGLFGGDPGGGPIFAGELRSTGHLAVRLYSDGAINGWSDNRLDDGEWHSINVGITPSGGYFYVDNVPQRTPPQSGGQTGEHLVIGSIRPISGPGWKPFVGEIDEFRVYNRSLSATEIDFLSTRSTPVTALPSPEQPAAETVTEQAIRDVFFDADGSLCFTYETPVVGAQTFVECSTDNVNWETLHEFNSGALATVVRDTDVQSIDKFYRVTSATSGSIFASFVDDYPDRASDPNTDSDNYFLRESGDEHDVEIFYDLTGNADIEEVWLNIYPTDDLAGLTPASTLNLTPSARIPGTKQGIEFQKGTGIAANWSPDLGSAGAWAIQLEVVGADGLTLFKSPIHDADRFTPGWQCPQACLAVHDLVRKHRPIINFHEDERGRPVKVEDFVTRSGGVPKYRDGDALTEHESVESGLTDLDSFFDFGDDAERTTDLDQYPTPDPNPFVYHSVNDSDSTNFIFCQYWMFYDFSQAPLLPEQNPLVQHEGDLEHMHVTLRISNDEDSERKADWLQPWSATASQHFYAQTLRWDASDGTRSFSANQQHVERRKDRPVVYVALGAHATYFRAGTICVPDVPQLAILGTQEQYDSVPTGAFDITASGETPYALTPLPRSLLDDYLGYWGFWDGNTNLDDGTKGPWTRSALAPFGERVNLRDEPVRLHDLSLKDGLFWGPSQLGLVIYPPNLD